MNQLGLAIALGLSSALLFWLALRPRWAALAWIALIPLDHVVLSMTPAHVIVAAAITGMLSTTPVVVDRTQQGLIRLVALSSALAWSAAFGCGAWLYQRFPSPWTGALILPLAAVCALLPLRLAGAPRWVYNPIARTQEVCLPVVHMARLGSDLVVAAVLAAVSGGLTVLLTTESPRAAHWFAASAAIGCALSALAYGAARFRAARRVADSAVRVRMAAIAVNVPPPDDGPFTGLWVVQSPRARDVSFALSRYELPVKQAAADGAELVVLPECAVCVDEQTRATWLDTLAAWAKREQVAIVAPYSDDSVPSNTLAIFDALGNLVAEYQKQHPALGIEPKPMLRTPLGPHHVQTRNRTLPLSAVICVDLDYADVIDVAKRAGGVLNVPANDWPSIERMHHRTAVWAAAMSGVPILRATGHGISSVYDGAGRVLASQSSLAGPVTLVVDIPLAPPCP
jgi:predicted amidohydrolase